MNYYHQVYLKINKLYKSYPIQILYDVNQANVLLRNNDIIILIVFREQIKFKKTNLGYDVYFDGKLIGEMNDITQDLKDDNPDLYKGRKKVFNLHTLDSRGYPEPAFETIDTLADAKYVMKQVIASDLTNPESDTYRTFVKQKYDKKVRLGHRSRIPIRKQYT